MATAYILYNSKAGKGENLDALTAMLKDDYKIIDVLKVKDYDLFLGGLEKDDYIIIAGGDGTINHFANDTANIQFENDVLLYPNGTGNDFAKDVGKEKGCEPFSIKKYLNNLPTVTVNGQKSLFINAIGYGIDGYCCEVGDKQKAEGKTDINYTGIAIKGLLFHFKPVNAKVTVDGVEYNFKKAWLAPAMHGRFYGGGMMAAPEQNRESEDKILSVMVFHGKGRLQTLMAFPSIFKGEHVKKENIVKVIKGKEITVEFDRPTALQIDGETVLGVTSYSAITADAKVLA